MYRRILVPIDGSSTALEGLTEALRLARAFQARIKLVHVASELSIDPAVTPSVYYEFAAEGRQASGHEALANAQALANEQGADVEVQLIEATGARAADAIVAAAQQWPADLIVMGTHGRSGVRRLALGSDAEMVLRSAPVPVLMVREGVTS
ncbi:universal stress protein [Steroidobacter cummioxidans]|uniref:universal stress protein n=1 Tax=Steroidobacter cummioxidans TaxID=1803913 RepID=UPI000E30E8A5|nr:universal stress protein [Steroidobacter cummioxidans]